MSVILDALRRSRGGAEPRVSRAAAPVVGVPAGFGLGSPSKPAGTARARSRSPLVWLLAVFVVALAAWSQRAPSPVDAASPSAPAMAPAADATFADRPDRVAAPDAPVPSSAPQPVLAAVEEHAAGSGARLRDERSAVAAPSPQVAGGRPIGPSAAARSRPVRSKPPADVEPLPAASVSAPAPASPAPSGPSVVPSLTDFELAVRHQALGNYEQALQHYMAALRASEFNVEARNNLGLLYHQRGLTTEAIDQFRRALLIDPQYVRARSNLAVVLTAAGRLAEARAELRAALAAEPRNVDLLVNKALVEKADGEPAAAIEVLLEALRLEPRHAVANYNIAVLYEEEGAMALAYDHYGAFLAHAMPQHAGMIADVQARVGAMAPLLATAEAQ